MRDVDRFQLRFGPYKTPRVRYGDSAFDAVRGEVEIVGITDAKIPWPLGKRGRATTMIVYRGLEKAIRNESNQAVCHWFGITPQTVSKWRKVLGVDPTTPGTSALRRDHITPSRKRSLKRGAIAAARRPERIEKIRQSKLGKPRPESVREALRVENTGRNWNGKTRRHQMDAKKRRFPKNYAPWTAEEDEIVRTCTITEVAARTGRSKNRVELRRSDLGITGRRK